MNTMNNMNTNTKRIEINQVTNKKFYKTSKPDEDNNNRYYQYKQSHLANSMASPKYETPQHFQIIPEQEPSEQDKVTNLKKQYDNRLKNLYSELKLVISKIDQDEYLKTMKQDPTTSEFYTQRLKEIIDENLHLEREELVKNLNEDLAGIKEKFVISEKQNVELIETIKNISDSYEKKLNDTVKSQNLINNEYNKLKSNMQGISSTYDSELKRVVDDCNNRLTKQNLEINRFKEENSKLNERLLVIYIILIILVL